MVNNLLIDLPDVCLINVLRHLNLQERLNFERVCKRWLAIMPYFDIDRIDFNQLTWSSSATFSFEYRQENMYVWQRALRRRSLNSAVDALTSRTRDIHSLILRSRDFRCLLSQNLLSMMADQWASSLQKLDLYGCFLPIAAMPILRRLTCLRSLLMASIVFLVSENVALSGDDFSMVKREMEEIVVALTMLQQLDLSSAKFYPTLPISDDTSSDSCISALNLLAVPMINADLQNLSAACPQLTCLAISYCGDALTDFRPISRLFHLQSLICTNCRLSDLDLAEICSWCRQLEELRIDNCAQLTQFSPIKSLKLLKILWLGPSSTFTPDVLCELASNKRLEKVSLNRFSQVNNDCLIALAQNCTKLIQLSVNHAELVSDAGVCRICRNCPAVDYLNLNATGISNESFKAIGQHCKLIRTLLAESCAQLGEGCLEWMVQKRKRWLDLEGNGGECDLQELQIIYGDENFPPPSERLIERLAQVKVKLCKRGRLLALPGY